jgi:WD40 repeat protein
VRIWDLETRTEIIRFNKEGRFIIPAAFSPDGRHLSTGDAGGFVHFWDAATGKEINRINAHEAEVWSLEFSPEGRHLLTGSWDGTVRVWDTTTGDELLTLAGHKGAVNGARFMPDGNTILTTSDDQFARLWNRQSGELLRQFPIMVSRFSQVVLSEAGRFFYVGGGNHIGHRYDVESGVEDGRFVGHTDLIYGLALSPDGNRLYTGSWDGTARIWQTDLAKLVSFVGHLLPKTLLS